MRRLPVLLLLLFGACQTYDFEHVPPFALASATRVKPVHALGAAPNLMLVVDNSGSMKEPIAPGAPQCQTPKGPCGLVNGDCPAGCATRVSEMKSAMDNFLRVSGSTLSMGLTVFPDPGGAGSCPTGITALDFPAGSSADALQQAADEVRARVLQLAPKGGTPTAETLRRLLQNPRLKTAGHDTVVLLLTDGLPNCSDAFGTVNACFDTQCNCSRAPTDGRSCLDDAATLAAVNGLAWAQVLTFVVGFGADTAQGRAADLLNSLATAGGSPRKCKTTADCGTSGGACLSTGKCERQYYQATNHDELGAALDDVRGIIDPKPCLYEFDPADQPTDARFVTVVFDGQVLPSGPDTWTYADGVITFAPGGAACAKLRASSVDHPVSLEVRTVQGM